MNCVFIRRDGQRCTCRKNLRLIGGVSACEFHYRVAARLWADVRDTLPADVRLAAERDTRERNHRVG